MKRTTILMLLSTLACLPTWLPAAGEVGSWSPRVILRDGVDAPGGSGGAPGTTDAMDQEPSIPTALAAGDFDEDGVRDLVIGHIGLAGATLTLYRGNIKSLWPETGGQEPASRDPAPFLGAAKPLEIPIVPDYLGAISFSPAQVYYKPFL